MSTSRYLTAQKISLLVLVKLYCSSVAPSSATIPILSFIVSHAIPPVQSHARARRPQENQDASFSIQAFEDVLQPHASSMPGQTLLDLFLKQMWGINSFDNLHDLFNNLSDLLVKSREEIEQDPAEQSSDRIYLSKTSPLGAFVRRARLEFTRLQFDDAMKLWTAFITYRAPTSHWSKRIAGLGSTKFDENVEKMDLRPGDELFEIAYGHLSLEDEGDQILSTDDYERLLDFQLDQLQRKFRTRMCYIHIDIG